MSCGPYDVGKDEDAKPDADATAAKTQLMSDALMFTIAVEDDR